MSNVHYAADGHAVVRVVADEAPVAGARALDPTLEDVYLYVFRDEVVPPVSYTHLDVYKRQVCASCAIAREKGSYGFFEGSGWQTGDYFRDSGLTDGRWAELARDVAEHGLRNGYLLAVAPTS